MPSETFLLMKVFTGGFAEQIASLLLRPGIRNQIVFHRSAGQMLRRQVFGSQRQLKQGRLSGRSLLSRVCLRDGYSLIHLGKGCASVSVINSDLSIKGRRNRNRNGSQNGYFHRVLIRTLPR
ncbi:hypothetical protein CDAR_488041 [Caerostris darwini]|uniref:Uncharacterized protein n=1 Tax=Caerostris darwini TaxID=1538125 RepID=A0AAV4MBW5_9ARAC|nr:hypothetical protein CDAR_488041 [Caerostris darwini]